MKAICPGSFDPITLGHYAIIRRAAALFDEVIVVVSSNSEKKYMFSEEKRFAFAKAAFVDIPNVRCVTGDGWVADLAAKYGADVIVKGLRNGADCDYESAIAAVNRHASKVETLFLSSESAYGHISSTVVRELIKYGKDYAPMLPPGVAALMDSRLVSLDSTAK